MRGHVEYGKRAVNPEQAAVIERICEDYARGLSPKKIAEALNVEGIPAPRGGDWGSSTINGNRDRGTGILNNVLYIGQLVWPHLRYSKDPDTKKRGSTLNAPETLLRINVPELRIVDEVLWQAARQRQGTLKTKDTDVPVWDRRRPKFLF